MREAFSCSACGACHRCRGSSPLSVALDRGKGVCRHLDDGLNLFRIYDVQPEFCRVEDMHRQFEIRFSWLGFVN